VRFQNTELLDSLFAKRRESKSDLKSHQERLSNLNQLKTDFEKKISDLKDKIKIETLCVEHMAQTVSSLDRLILQIQHGGIDAV
jgi:transposase